MHFFSVVGMILSVWHTGLEGIRGSLTRVAPMLECPNSVEQGSPSVAIAYSESNVELVRLVYKSVLSLAY